MFTQLCSRLFLHYDLNFSLFFFFYCTTTFNQDYAKFPQQKNMKTSVKAVGNGDHVPQPTYINPWPALTSSYNYSTAAAIALQFARLTDYSSSPRVQFWSLVIMLIWNHTSLSFITAGDQICSFVKQAIWGDCQGHFFFMFFFNANLSYFLKMTSSVIHPFIDVFSFPLLPSCGLTVCQLWSKSSF